MDGTLERLQTLLQLSDEFEQTMSGNLVGTIAPGIINIAGVLLLHTGFGMGLYYLSSAGQLGYTLYPLAKHQDKALVEEKHKE
ncbi:hypothetical protein QUF61_03935 [Candidatus Venteria ishoeyi]|nr:hypothetical protein [Candidatus Venteria ishoeyi]